MLEPPADQTGRISAQPRLKMGRRKDLAPSGFYDKQAMMSSHISALAAQKNLDNQAVAMRFDQLMARSGTLGLFISRLLLWGAITTSLWVVVSRPEFMASYLTLVLPTIAVVRFWSKTLQTPRLPILPMLVVQLCILFAAPIAIGGPNLSIYSLDVTQVSAFAFASFCLFLVIGFRTGLSGKEGTTSRYIFALPSGAEGQSRLLFLGNGILLLTAASQLASFLGLIEMALGRNFSAIYPVYRSIEYSAALGGSFLGAYAVSSSSRASLKSTLFWSLIACDVALRMTSLLLSATMMVTASVIFGCLAGSRRIPWMFIVIMGLTIALFQEGKSEMRERYFTKNQAVLLPTQPIARLCYLPSFFYEWIELSLQIAFNPASLEDNVQGDESFSTRMDNLVNLNAVTDRLLAGVSTFGHRSYSEIPALMIPRFLWPDKPRMHVTQSLFNIHFGRQQTLADTESTCISIGLLAEATGSLGLIFGPALLGLCGGFFIGRFEKFAQYKQILSLEGIAVLVVVLMLALSFELTAAVFISSLAQKLITALGPCLFLTSRVPQQRVGDGLRTGVVARKC